ncbi:MAG: hypothetical protein ACKOC5_04795 [Chloroflexota bacterium]
MAAVLPYFYLRSEHIFYYWDYANFHNITQRVAGDLNDSLLRFVIDVGVSLAKDYNYLFSLPLVLFTCWLPLDRIGYVVRLALVSQLPYILAAGWLASLLVSEKRRLAFWLGAWTSALFPIAWAPALRGYPDVAAALMIALAIGLYLRRPTLDSRRQRLAIGLALAAAALLRRHYVYDLPAFFIAAAAAWAGALLIQRRAGQTLPLSALKRQALDLVYTLLSAVGWLLLLGLPFVVLALMRNYGRLYASYELGVLETAGAYLAFFGWQSWLAATAGYVLALVRPGHVRRAGAAFVVVLGLVTWLVWISAVRNAATHYTLHLTVFLTLGISLLGYALMTRLSGLRRAAAGALFFAWLLCSFILSLSPAGAQLTWQAGFAENYTPLQRADYAEVERLVGYLRQAAAGGQPVYTAASSAHLNEDLLKNAEQAIYHERLLNIQYVPYIDSRDYYPLERLLQADWVVLAVPPQYTLKDTAQQKVLTSVVEAFSTDWEIAGDFALQPERWQLQPDFEVQVYRRVRPTTLATAVQTYARLAAFINRRPAGQADWITLTPGAPLPQTTLRGDYRLELAAPGLDQPAAYLYVNGPVGLHAIEGRWAYQGQNCPAVRVQLEYYAPSGELLQSIRLLEAAAEQQAGFSQSLPASSGQPVLSLHPAAQLTAGCSLQLNWNMLHTPQ